MVRLNFNATGWLFQDGLRNLSETFAAATDGVDRRLQAAYDAVDQHDRLVTESGNDHVERDEDGRVVHDPREILLYLTTTAEEAKEALNKAIAIAVFHYWERSARGWVGKPNGKFVTLCKDVRALGYPVDEGLAHLQLLSNLLKHANSTHGELLLKARPGYFRSGFNAWLQRVDWYDAIVLDDQQVSDLFEIVAASGPRQDMVI